MEIDDQSLFAHGQTITGTSAAETVSESVLDLGKHGDDLLHQLAWFVHVDDPGDTGASGKTVLVKWKTSDDNSSYSTVYTGEAIGTLAKGMMLVDGLPLPKGLKRYNKLTFTVGSTAFTAAPKLTAGLVRQGTDVPNKPFGA